MSVAYGTGSVLAEATTVDSVFTAPASIADGDLLIIWLILILSGGAPPTPTPPTGFTAPAGTWPITGTFSTFQYAQYVWTKVASGESGNYTVSHGSCVNRGIMARITGADTTTPITPNPTQNSGTGATSTFTGLTTSVANELVILLGSDDNDNSNTYSVSGYTLQATTPGECLLTATQVSAGATGNQTMTNNSSTGTPWFGVVLAVQPAAGGGGGPDLNVYRIN